MLVIVASCDVLDAIGTARLIESDSQDGRLCHSVQITLVRAPFFLSESHHGKAAQKTTRLGSPSQLVISH
jgi:hypothetical protein